MTNVIVIDPTAYEAALCPLPIRELIIGTADLLSQGCDLPQPRYIEVSNSQSIGLQFSSDTAGVVAITKWAIRFGGVLESLPGRNENGCYTLNRVTFDYYGVAVEAYAVIWPEPATT